MNNSYCHCGLEGTYQNCCKPFVSKSKLAPTPEKLMRSRFSAFKLREHQYLIDTYKVTSQKECISVSDFDSSINWLGLVILASNQQETIINASQVEFVAFYQHNNKPTTKLIQLHERSNFENINGQWFYVSGTHLPDIKLQRNQACICNSGKKYKKCHGQ